MKNNNNFNREDGCRLSNTWRLAIPRTSDLECHGQSSSTDVQPNIAEPRYACISCPYIRTPLTVTDNNSWDSLGTDYGTAIYNLSYMVARIPLSKLIFYVSSMPADER
ncbi:hypothetical protein NQ318_023264 [Aromia moschata]|uniref:Uncharacterized protein n=1 Tax=Aromia moschata TaxID=1265417 RepID=A0AAV8Y5E2_9CUCU|nr:hypothetical protein NQ318_023264 [Aromia moschata]